MKKILYTIYHLVFFCFITKGFYDLQINGILEDGKYTVPSILSWFPELVGIKNYFMIASILLGLMLPFFPVGIYWIVRYEWIPSLRSKFGNRNS